MFTFTVTVSLCQIHNMKYISYDVRELKKIRLNRQNMLMWDRKLVAA